MAYAGPRVPTMAIYRVCFTEAPESAAFLRSKETNNEEARHLASVAYRHICHDHRDAPAGYGRISRYSRSRARSPCDGFLKPCLSTGSVVVSSTASSRPFIVGLWWMCEDNDCKTFKTKE